MGVRQAITYGFGVLGDVSGLTPWRRISFSACRFTAACCPMASRFTLSAQVGQIELVSTSRIPHNMHIFGLSAIHPSFIVVCEVVTGSGPGVKDTWRVRRNTKGAHHD